MPGSGSTGAAASASRGRQAVRGMDGARTPRAGVCLVGQREGQGDTLAPGAKVSTKGLFSNGESRAPSCSGTAIAPACCRTKGKSGEGREGGKSIKVGKCQARLPLLPRRP